MEKIIVFPMDKRIEKTISVVGMKYADHVLEDILSQAFRSYKKRDINKKWYKVSEHESTYSTMGIVLLAIAVESTRNRMAYLKKINHKSSGPAYEQLAEIIAGEDVEFPKQCLENILKELFVIRDVIAHNYIYEITTTFDRGTRGKMIDHRQKLVWGRGNQDKKFKDVSKEHRKTKILDLNLQPLEVSFEDLFMSVAILDLLQSLINKRLGNDFFPTTWSIKINESWESNVSHVLGWYHGQSHNQAFKEKSTELFHKLTKKFGRFVGNEVDVSGEKHLIFPADSIVSNFCPQPKCREFGFRKINKVVNCDKCGFKK